MLGVVWTGKILLHCWKNNIFFSLFKRSTAEAVEDAGFTKVDQKKYNLEICGEEVSMRFKIVRTFVKRHVMGVATK